jgi:hypothetical protein
MMAKKKKKGPTPKKHRLKMAVIPEPPPDSGQTIINPTPEFAASGKPFITSQRAKIILACGQCERILFKIDSTSQVQGGVWKCPGCGACNTTIQG